MGFTPALATITALGSGVTAAVYINFSARVMPRLAAMQTSQGIATMQQFNRNAVRAPFMLCFFGAAAAGSVLIIRALRQERGTASVLLILGAGLYLAGFALTIVYNVPRNDALAAVEAGSAHGSAMWSTYLDEWTTANSIRAVLSTLATVAVLAGAALLPSRPR